jgi:hypothetical protein
MTQQKVELTPQQKSTCKTLAYLTAMGIFVVGYIVIRGVFKYIFGM